MGGHDFGPGRPGFSYPLWLCAYGGEPNQGVMGGALEGGGEFAALFTDEDLAGRFLAALGAGAGVQPVAIPDAGTFAGTLRRLRAGGFTHALFDDPGLAGEARAAVAIWALLRIVEGAPEGG